MLQLKERMEEENIKEITPGLLPGIEGEMGDEWLVVDAGDWLWDAFLIHPQSCSCSWTRMLTVGSVVVHLFLEAERKYYNLEGLWGKTGNVKWLESQTSIETLDTIRAPP